VPVGQGGYLTIPPHAAPSGAIVEISSLNPPGHLANTEAPIRSPVHISLVGGSLTGNATLSFPYSPGTLPKGVNPESAFGVATYDELSASWVSAATSVSVSAGFIRITVAHFSWWDPWTWHWSALGSRVSQDILQVLGKRAGPAKCSSSLPSYVSSTTLDDEASVPIRGCAQQQQGALDVELVNNRNYGVIVNLPVPVTWARVGGGSSLLAALSVAIVKRFLPSDELYVPPLGTASIGVPNGSWTDAHFGIGPRPATVLIDLAELAFSDLPVSPAAMVGQIAEDCGRLIANSQLSATLAGVYALANAAAACLDDVLHQLRGTIKGGRATALVQKSLGVLEALRYAGDVGIGIDIGAELGDLILGTTVDRSLRSFDVYHSARTPTSTPTSTPATTPVTTPSAPSLAIGSAFDSLCVVDWPTAPIVTNNSIVMTMGCEEVPESEFLFTNVTYGDPQLPIEPDTGNVRVIGTVTGTARSDYGYKELIVTASNVIFPSNG
jgi:hypothetical protein